LALDSIVYSLRVGVWAGRRRKRRRRKRRGAGLHIKSSNPNLKGGE